MWGFIFARELLFCGLHLHPQAFLMTLRVTAFG
jgi:hypothetical protein